MIAMVGVVSSSLQLNARALSKGRQPRGAVLHSSREPGVWRPCSDFMDMLQAPYKLSYHHHHHHHCYHYRKAIGITILLVRFFVRK